MLWWGVVDFNGWTAEHAAARMARALRLAPGAGFAARRSGDWLVLGWIAPDDLNAAFRVLAERVGIEPGDFRPGRPPERLPGRGPQAALLT